MSERACCREAYMFCGRSVFLIPPVFTLTRWECDPAGFFMLGGESGAACGFSEKLSPGQCVDGRRYLFIEFHLQAIRRARPECGESELIAKLIDDEMGLGF